MDVTLFRPRADVASLERHIYSEYNNMADELDTIGLERCPMRYSCFAPLVVVIVRGL